MKTDVNKVILFLICGLISLLTSTYLFSQAPNYFNYQAVLRDARGNVKADENVSLEIKILQGSISGTTVFSETHNTSTNTYGLVNLKIGAIDTIKFNAIDWLLGSYFLRITVDGIIMGTSQLISVPYALHAKTSESISFSNGVLLPHNFGSDPDFIGSQGNSISFGHQGVSEDFIGYKNNTFYFKDAPGGGDESDPNIIIGGNVSIGAENPQSKLSVGDNGSTDVGITGRDTKIGVYGKADETHEDGAGVVGVNENGTRKGYLGGQNCGVKSDGDLVVVNGRYIGNIGPHKGAPYPMPAYISGWKSISEDEIKTLVHNIGGNVDNYVVDMSFMNGALGKNNRQMGGDYFKPFDENHFGGAYWFDLTNEHIKVHRWDHDFSASYIRIRIWVY